MGAHAELTESEYLLAGLTVAKSPAELPPTLTLPLGWTDGLRRLGAVTEVTNKEAGLCLGMVAEARTEDRNVLMARYAALALRQSQMGPKEYAAQEQALREQIEGKGSLAHSGAKWVVGEIQQGSDYSVNIEINGVKCEGENISDAHTHPTPSLEIPSDGDFAYFLGHKAAHSTMTVYQGGKVCVALKTGAVTTAIVRRGIADIYARHIAYINAVAFELIRKPILASDQFKAQAFRSGVASVAQASGIGLYCGTLGTPLARVAPYKVNAHDELFILQAKSLLLALRLTEPAANPAPLDFPFTPVMDVGFKQAIAAYGIDEQALAHTTPLDLYVQLLVRVLDQRLMTNNGAGIALPDYRRSLRPPITVGLSECWRADTLGEYVCKLARTEIQRIGKNEEKELYAYYQSKDGMWLVVSPDLAAGRRILARNTDRQTYKGECRFKNRSCVPDGKGEVDFKGEMQVRGTFIDGELRGEAIQVRHDSGETWRVYYETGGYRKIERIK